MRFEHRCFIFSALLSSTALAGAAHAQSASDPSHANWDENGVDVVTGDYQLEFVEATIGSGPAMLPLTRVNASKDRPHIWDRLRFSRKQAFSTDPIYTYIGLPDGSTAKFTNGVPDIPNGSTLGGSLGNYTLTLADGTAIKFVDPAGWDGVKTNFCNAGGSVNCDLVPESITYSNGEKISFAVTLARYTNPLSLDYTWRLFSVSNNFNYSIGFLYESTVPPMQPPDATWRNRISATFRRDNDVQATVSYNYDTPGVVKITDPTNAVWEVTSNSIKRPGETNPALVITGSAGAVTSVTRDGVTTGYNRSISGNVVTLTKTDAANNDTVITSDLSIDQPTSVKDAIGKTTTYSYQNGLLTKITQPEGNATEFELDSRGNAKTIKLLPKTGMGSITYSFDYDDTCTNPVTCNQPNSMTDPAGKVTDYDYDQTHGQITSVTRPAPTNVTGAVQPQTRYGYTLKNGIYLLTSVSECQTRSSCSSAQYAADEVRTTLAYGDDYGNVKSVTTMAGDNSLSATSTITYTGNGDVESVNGPLAGAADTTKYRYDAARRVQGVISPDPDGPGVDTLLPRATKITRDAAGRETKIERGTLPDQDSAWSQFTSYDRIVVGRDDYGRVVEQRLAGSAGAAMLTQISYDNLGRPYCSAIRMNPATYNALPASACTLATEGSFGPDRITRVVYSALGQVRRVFEAYGTAEQDSDGDQTLTYTDNGKLSSFADANNNLTSFQYDEYDRPWKTLYPSPTTAGTSSATDYEQLTYDTRSNVTALRLRDGSVIGYTPDNLNRVVLKNLPGSEPDVSYTYDNLDRPLTAKFTTTSEGVTNEYDALSRLVSTTTNVGGTARALTYEYDLANRRTQTRWWDNFFVTYDYLVTGEMKAVRENGTAVLTNYNYDPTMAAAQLGLRTGITRAGGNGAKTNYDYDHVMRLTTLTHNLSGAASDLTKTFTYNPASQIVSETRSNDAYAFAHANGSAAYDVNGLNEIKTVNAANVDYDDKGNLTTESSIARTYTYDSENRMTSSSAGAVDATLRRDPLGRLESYDLDPGATTRFIYDPVSGAGSEVAAEVSLSGTITRRYVRGEGADEILLEYVGSGSANPRYHLLDERMSAIAEADATGAMLTINAYDEYGMPAADNTGRFQYTGQMWLGEVGAYNYKARMYAPHLGRFMQTDPIGHAGGVNLYAYVGNDPVNSVDPSGEDWVRRHVKSHCVSVGDGTEYCSAPYNVLEWVPGGSDRGPSVGGPLQGPGGAAGAEEEARKELCKNLQNRVNKSKAALSSFQTNYSSWNDINALQRERAWIQRDLNDFRSVNRGLDWVEGLGALGGFLGIAGRALSLGVTGTLGATGVIAGQTAASIASSKTAQIRAINARINQLLAQRAGICP